MDVYEEKGKVMNWKHCTLVFSMAYVRLGAELASAIFLRNGFSWALSSGEDIFLTQCTQSLSLRIFTNRSNTL